MILALNQLLPKAGDPDTNLLVMEQTIKRNAGAGAKLCLFPEDFLYGVLRDQASLLEAAKRFNQWVEAFCQLARKHRVDVIPGTLPRFDNGDIFNTAVYIDKTGKVLAEYSKHNLWLSERDEYTPSLEVSPVFQSVLGSTALIICWDMLDHRLFESAVRQGAQWVICLSFWSVDQCEDLRRMRGGASGQNYGFSDSSWLKLLVPARAMEYNIGMVFCNFGGAHTYRGSLDTVQRAISAGSTQVVTPYKAQYEILRSKRPATLLVDVDLHSALQALNDAEIWCGRREDIIGNYPYGPRGAT